MFQVNQYNAEVAEKFKRERLELLESLKGFSKVDQSGSSYIVATFYNPTTEETRSETVRDYDYDDKRNDVDELYYMPIDNDVRRQWLHKNGAILAGDVVEVFKGRKVKIGTVARVTEIKPYYDHYGRWTCDYAYLDNGQRTNVNNCKIKEFA